MNIFPRKILGNAGTVLASLIALILLPNTDLQAQTYPYFPYAGNSIGQKHVMPGDSVVDTTGLIQGSNGFVNPWEFDRAANSDIMIPTGDSSAYQDFLVDSGAVIGIIDMGNDAGGGEKRYTSKKFPNGIGNTVAAMRWNGGWNGWRRSGKWALYTLEFPAGDYQLVYRFRDDNNSSYSLHKLRVTVFSAANVADTLLDYTIDLSDDGSGAVKSNATPGDTIDNIIYIGGNSSMNSGYAKGLPVLNIPSNGDYILRLEELGSGQGMFSTFTFNTAASTPPPPPPADSAYTYFPYAGLSIGQKHLMPGDTIRETSNNNAPGLINPWEYDRAVNAAIMVPAGDSTAYGDYQADSGAVFGITDTVSDPGGGEKRGYVSKKFPNGAAGLSAAIRWNNGWNGWRRSGKWAYYTMNFPAGDYQFVYRARVDNGASFSLHGLKLTLLSSSNVADTLADVVVNLSDDTTATGDILKDIYAPGDTIDNVLYLGGGDSTNFGLSQFFRVLDVFTVPDSGDYVLRYEETIPGQGIFGNFTFNPAMAADTNMVNGISFEPEGLTQFYAHEDRVVVEFSSITQASIQVADLSGRLLLETEFKGSRFDHATGLQPGIYLLRVQTPKGIAMRKVRFE